MEIFDGKNKKWTIPSDAINENNRYQKLELKNIEVKKRIGSPSTMAQVFQVEINSQNDSIPIAAKLLPICNEESVNSNKNEMEIAFRASELVLNSENLINCFPIVYNTDSSLFLCKETYFYDKDEKYDWYNKSKRYQQFGTILSNKYPDKFDKIMLMKRQIKDPEIIVKALNLDIELPTKIESHILFSELAYCDLGYYLNSSFEEDYKFYYEIIKQVFKAIETLHTKLNVVHRDLHLGNILVLSLENPIILIHDFGKSKFSDFDTYVDKVNDISYFLSQITDESKNLFSIPYKLKEYINQCIDILDENIDMKYPITKVVEFWENL